MRPAPGSFTGHAARSPAVRARTREERRAPATRSAHKSCSSGSIGATFRRMIFIAVSLTVALVTADLLELTSRRRDRL
jgi:hypothetical protein